LPKIAYHTSNSSALFRDNNFNDDICRIGTAIFGYLDNQNPLYNPNLKPVLSLIANKISTRVIKKGQSIGYGATFTAKENMTVSTYDIGYADGFLRMNPTIPFYTKEGLEILGRVSMDNISVVGDKEQICIFDNVNNLANIRDTISYEILTSLSKDIKREIV
jgi:alanine racemase